MRGRKIYERLRAGAPLAACVFLLFALIGPFIPWASTVPAAVGAADTTHIIRFERNNPAYTEVAPVGTARDGLRLPASLRAVVRLPEGADTAAFRQARPACDTSDGTEQYDYYHYGYVAPKDSDALYGAGGRVVYTIYYAAVSDASGPDSDGGAAGVGDEAYRIYGSVPGVDGGRDEWYDCDASGEAISGVVTDVAVRWDGDGAYESSKPGVCRFTAQVPSEYDYKGDAPTAEITFEDESAAAGCCDGEDECANEAGAGDGAEDVAAGGGSDDRDGSATTDTAQKRNRSAMLKSVNGGGANDLAGDAKMAELAPTSGNQSVNMNGYSGNLDMPVTVPGIWIDYINTMWMNTGYKKFEWKIAKDTGAWKDWEWDGTEASIAATSTETAQDNPNVKPEKVNGVYTVYSGQQLLYAMKHCENSDVINLAANINLNGSMYTWPTVNKSVYPDNSKALRIDGKGHSIFNLGVTTDNGADNYAGGLAERYESLMLKDLKFENAKLVKWRSSIKGSCQYTGLLFAADPDQNISGTTRTMTNVEVKNSLFFGFDLVSPFGGVGGSIKMTKCYAHDNYVYGRNHLGGFCTDIYLGTVEHCGTWNTLLCGTGGHSSGFIPCFSRSGNTIKNCFTNMELYGSRFVGGFTTIIGGTISNCYATGKIEGYSDIGGFMATTGNLTQTVSNCYSTCLVGLRSPAQEQGGFAAPYYVSGKTNSNTLRISNCYAAGEVGNTDTNLDDPVDVGGFFNQSTNAAINHSVLSSNYYDKQTTAMREWTAGNTKTVAGITGVLTSTCDKGGTGLASGTYGSSSDKGFRGFSDNGKWVYTAQHYPQLKVFADATAADWGADFVDTVKANSKASAATVFLDTWDKGYDWDSNGVRSLTEKSYDRSLASTGKTDHEGYRYTYDTVREIVSDAPVTSTASWEHMIPGGAPVDEDNNGQAESGLHAMDISASGGIKILVPGMDWYRIGESSGQKTGSRPIRLIAFQRIEAGEDKTVSGGDTYDHRRDVRLWMMKNVTPNLVVGPDNDKVWSTATEGGYPDSPKYWAVPTDNVKTEMSATADAWIYTEIWRAQRNSDGSFATDSASGMGSEKLVPELSVKVTGADTGEGMTLTERQWNGEEQLFTETSAPQKYIITYYWMLKDGRYRTDTKIVTVTPGRYTLTVDSKDADTDKPNGKRLYLAAAEDSGADTDYSYGAETSSHTAITDVPYTTNAAAAWMKRSGTVKVVKAELEFTERDRTYRGSKTITGNITSGSAFDVPIVCHYIKRERDDAVNADREIVCSEGAIVTYKICGDAAGGYYLRFDKLVNAPDYEADSAKQHGTDEGIPAGVKAYINEMMSDVHLTLWTTNEFAFTKTDRYGDPLPGVEFKLYDNTGAAIRATSGSDGQVTFKGLDDNDYTLVETKALPGYSLPEGKWLIDMATDDDIPSITAVDGMPPAFRVDRAGTGEGATVTLSLPNYEKSTLTLTGGKGTEIFTEGGIILLGAAAIAAVLRRRRRERTRRCEEDIPPV